MGLFDDKEINHIGVSIFGVSIDVGLGKKNKDKKWEKEPAEEAEPVVVKEEISGKKWAEPAGGKPAAATGTGANPCKLEVILGDIVTQGGFQAVVNPTNEYFVPGPHSVDRFLFEAAGPGLMAECKRLGRCPVGGAEVTGGYNLPYAYVIHVVGKKWKGEKEGEVLLGQCYESALEAARSFKIRSVLFPVIGSGSNGFPITKASGIAVSTVEEFVLANPGSFDRIAWVVNKPAFFQIFQTRLGG